MAPCPATDVEHAAFRKPERLLLYGRPVREVTEVEAARPGLDAAIIPLDDPARLFVFIDVPQLLPPGIHEVSRHKSYPPRTVGFLKMMMCCRGRHSFVFSLR